MRQFILMVSLMLLLIHITAEEQWSTNVRLKVIWVLIGSAAARFYLYGLPQKEGPMR
jgi:hypothetical protein